MSPERAAEIEAAHGLKSGSVKRALAEGWGDALVVTDQPGIGPTVFGQRGSQKLWTRTPKLAAYTFDGDPIELEASQR